MSVTVRAEDIFDDAKLFIDLNGRNTHIELYVQIQDRMSGRVIISNTASIDILPIVKECMKAYVIEGK